MYLCKVFDEVWGSSRGKVIHNHQQYGQYLKRMRGFEEFHLWKK
jgi:hypothetical protein